MSSLALQFLLLTVAAWMTRDHQRVTAYLLAENIVLREQLRGRQGLGNKLIFPMNDNAANSGRIVRRQRLGGVLYHYYRDVA